jgi:hypothetical protein
MKQKRIPDNYNEDDWGVNDIVYRHIQEHLQKHGWTVPHYELDHFVTHTLWRFLKRNAVPFEDK